MISRISTRFLVILMLVGGLMAGPVRAETPAYRLTDLYRLALARAEQIGISQEDLALAERLREKALSVLIPRFSAVSTYKRFSEEKIVSGSVVQPEWDAAWGLTAEQQFTLNGRELTALRIAEDGIEKSRHDLDAVKEAYLLSIAAVFYDVAGARKNLEIADANVRRLTIHRDAVLVRLKLAEVPKTELFRTEAELSQARADRIRVQNGLRLAYAILARLSGLEQDFQIRESKASTGIVTQRLADLKAVAVDHRAEIKSLTLQEKIATKQIRFNQGAYWPTIGVQGAWMRMDQEPAASNDESIFLGLQFDWPIYDGGLRRAEVGEARSLLRQANLARADAVRQINVEVEEAWLDFDTQRGVITSLEAQLKYADENYLAVSRLFKHGMANSVDVMDANTLLLTAQRQLSEARYNLRLAAIRLKRAQGVFLADVQKQIEKTIRNGN